jgi:outer membrane immunogenic protein
MKSFLVAIPAVAIAFATTASAADMGLPMKAPAPLATPVFSWTGCYLGGNVGAGANFSSWTDSEYEGNGIGAVAGGQVGCNYQIKRLVVGIEGEFDWSGIRNRYNENYPEIGDPDYNNGSYIYSTQTQNLWDSTLALRAGFTPWDDLLIYGKVGAAWGSFKNSETCCNYSALDPDNYSYYSGAKVVTGLVFGAGFEYAITQNWTAKLEYEYIDYGNPSFNFAYNSQNDGTPVSGSYTTTNGQHMQIVKVGLNYLFTMR